MRAGAVSAAALDAKAPSAPVLIPQHCSEEFYRGFIETTPVSRVQQNRRLAARRAFVERWPDLGDWFSMPLYERVGRLPLERRSPLTCPVSYEARSYLLFLALRGYIHLDYAWMLGVGHLRTERLALQLGIDLGIEALTTEALRLGFDRVSSLASMRWCVGRIALHTCSGSLSFFIKNATESTRFQTLIHNVLTIKNATATIHSATGLIFTTFNAIGLHIGWHSHAGPSVSFPRFNATRQLTVRLTQ